MDKAKPQTGVRDALPAATVVLAAAAVAGLLVLAVAWLLWGQGLSVADVKGTILSWGAWGVLASIGLMILHSFVPFPAEIVACANGMAYGPFWGTVVTWFGAMLGAFAAFGLSRRLGRPFVDRMVTRENWRALDEWTGTQGWQVVLVGRFTPVIAFNVINYAAGLTRIPWSTFAWTTGLGILPLTALMVVMGDNFDMLSLWGWLALFAGGLVLWIALRTVWRRRAAGPIVEGAESLGKRP